MVARYILGVWVFFFFPFKFSYFWILEEKHCFLIGAADVNNVFSLKKTKSIATLDTYKDIGAH